MINEHSQSAREDFNILIKHFLSPQFLSKIFAEEKKNYNLLQFLFVRFEALWNLIYLSVCLPFVLFVFCLFVCLSCLFICCLFVCLSCLVIRLSVHLFVCSSVLVCSISLSMSMRELCQDNKKCSTDFRKTGIGSINQVNVFF